MGNAKTNYVAGTWRAGDQTVPNINPSDTSDVIGEFAQASPRDAEEAAASASAAFPAWSQSSPQERADVLDRIGTTILHRKEELGRLLSREEGKTLGEGIGEVTRAGHIFKFFSGTALRQTGGFVAATRGGVNVEVTREPAGVVGLITPWNFPIAIPAWKIAPALACGNCVVLKPAELVPASAHALATIIAEAGLPDGVFNLVVGKGSVIGDVVVASPHVQAVSFTGSLSVGRAIAAKAVAMGKKLQLEMGGKNPLVVLDDADLAVAVEAATNGAYFSTGQRCTASSRIIVTENIHDVFVAALTERISRLAVGHALEIGTEIGPVVDQRQLDQDLRYLEIGVAEGARLFGGQLLRRPTTGYFLAPALFIDTQPAMRINREEIFGPIASVQRVKDYDEALAAANHTSFGLSAGICTTDQRRAAHFRRHVQAGMVMVNLPTAGVDYHVPFGGRKDSSYGPREQGDQAVEFFTIGKTAYVAN